MADDAEFEEEEGAVEGLEEELICPEGAPEWLVTFGDMMSLLLTFFILLLSFAEMDALKFKQIAGSIKQALGVPQPEPVILIEKAKDIVELEFSVDFNARRVLQKLKREMDPLSVTRKKGNVDIEVYESYLGVTVLIPARMLFDPGTDRLLPDAGPLLEYLAREAADQPHDLVVEARHPSQVPMSPRFADPWALTSFQSVAAAQFLRRAGLADRKVQPSGRGNAAPLPRSDGTVPQLTVPSVSFLFLSKPMVSGHR